MTALRPEREGAAYGPQEPDPYASYEPSAAYDAYEGVDTFAAAVEGLDDPLNDPLPGQAPAPAQPRTGPGVSPRARRHAAPGGPPAEPVAERAPVAPAPPPSPADTGPRPTGRRRRRAAPEGGQQAPPAPRPPSGGRHAGRTGPTEGAPPAQSHTGPRTSSAYGTAAHSATPYAPAPAPEPGRHSAKPPPGRGPGPGPGSEDMGSTAVMPTVPSPPPSDATVVLRKVTTGALARGVPDTTPEPGAPGGRAARRRAAQEAARRGGRRAGERAADGDSATAEAVGAARRTAPRTRMEAKRAARARKDTPVVVISRLVGELFITLGVLMLLFVTYQLWWTNIRAHQQANGAANNLHKKWDHASGDDRDAGAFSPGEGFAIMYIPKLDVKAPIAEGTSKHKVLDRGMVGHYAEGALKTAMPWDKKGNFAVAGHRNTHGEPFRYINHLKPGDKIVVETQSSFYTYEMSSILSSTPPSNTGVIKPVPPGSGFTEPGRYITLTTCTPEFTSKYRMIVWGKLVDEQPRSKGKPDALVE